MKKLIIIVICVFGFFSAHSQIITTFAGNGSSGFSGDNGLATAAKIGFPGRIAIDDTSNVYFADTYNNRIRKISASTGIITTVAGTGTAGYNGDGALATASQLNYPFGVAVDHYGNIYIADTYNNRIRKISATTKLISTVAGTTSSGYNGDNISAITAQLNQPNSVCLDNAGNIYFTDQINNRVRKVAISTGNISTIAGSGSSGYMGDNGTAIYAQLNSPSGIALDANNNIYIADLNNHRIRKVTVSTGVITTIAGNGTGAYVEDGVAATLTSLSLPHDVFVTTAGHVFIADYGNGRIRKINASTGIISTVAGDGSASFAGDNGPATSAKLNMPISIRVDNAGNYFISDYFNRRIRKVTQPVFVNNTISGAQTICAKSSATISGTIPTGCTGVITYTWLNSTVSATSGFTSIANSNLQNFTTTNLTKNTWFKRLAVTSGCNVDTSAAVLITVDIPIGKNEIGATATMSRITGSPTGSDGSTGDGGLAINAKFRSPIGICTDSANNIFIADAGNHRIRKINASTGIISNFAGTSSITFNGDSIVATAASLYSPSGIAINPNGDLFICDRGHDRIRMVSKATGLITTYAGTGTSGYDGDGLSAKLAKINNPLFLTFDAAGNLFFVDCENYRIRKVNRITGVISTIAGTGVNAFSADGILATLANIQPEGVAIDIAGNIYFSERNHHIRKIDLTTGLLSTIAGTGVSSSTGDGGLAINAAISYPEGMHIDKYGNLIFAEYFYGKIRHINLKTGIIMTVAGGGFNMDPSNSNPLSVNLGLVADIASTPDGSIYSTSYDNSQAFKFTLPFSDQLICAGFVPDSIVGTTPIGGLGLGYSYQWLKSTTSATAGFTAIANSNKKNYAAAALSQTTWFKRVVTSGVCANDTSVAVKITIQNPITNNIITNPTQIICAGSSPATITASIPSGGVNASYNFNWLSSTTSATAGFTAIASSNTQNYTPGVLTQSTWFRRVVTSGACGVDTTVAIKIIVTNPISTNQITSNPQTICSGSVSSQINASQPIGGDGLNYIYTWLKSTTSASTGFAAISVSNVKNYTPVAITQNTWYKRVVSSGACANDTSAAIKVSVTNPILSNSITSSTQTICSGSVPSQISASQPSAGDGANYIFTWLKSTTSATAGFAAIASSNSRNYTPTAINQNTWFRRVVSSGACNNDTSAAISFSITTPITFNEITSNLQTVCSGSVPSQINATQPTGGDGLNYIYTWLKSTTSVNAGFAAISASNVKNYTPVAITQNTWYKRVVSSGACANDTSAAIKLSISTPISNNVILSSSQVICSLTMPPQINASAAAGGDGVNYTYTWLKSTSSATTGFTAIVSSNVRNYTPTVITQNTWFRRVVSSGVCNNDTSAAINISITSPISTNQITSNPQTICSGSVPSQINATQPTGGDGVSYNYTWLKSTTSASAGFAAITSSNVKNYLPTLITQNTWYKRVVTSGACANDTSMAIKISVTNPISSNTLTSVAQTICSGSVPAQITASTATGGDGLNYSYQWLISTTNATIGYLALDSAYSQNYSPKALFQNTWFKRVVSSGLCATDTSPAIAITLNYPITGNSINNSLQVICKGETPPQLIATIPSGGDGVNYTYQWLRSITNSSIGYVALDSSNTQNYSPKALFQNTWFKRVVTAGTCVSDTSASIFILITNPVVNNTITTGSYSLCEGNSPSEIRATKATGGDGLLYIYSWLSSTTNANSGFSEITASNTQNYTPSNLTKSTWFKRIVISGACNADTSMAVLVNIEKIPAKPIISAIAANELSSTLAQSYQWYFNNNVITSANNRNLIITKNGNYSVKIDSVNGCSNSSNPYNVSTLGVDELSEDSKISIYPNPATNEIYISLNASNLIENTLIEIFDLKGAKIYSVSQTLDINKPLKIDLKDLVSGLYFIRINQQAFKFVKAN